MEDASRISDSATTPMNMDGQLDEALPTRSDVLQQLSGTHERFQFRNRCNWEDALDNFTEAVVEFQSFAVVATREKQVVGIVTVDMDTLMLDWIESLKADWSAIAPQSADDAAKYKIHLDYACTGGGDRSEKGTQKFRGTMRLLLFGLERIVDRFFVQTAANVLFYDQWSHQNSRQGALLQIRKSCDFRLFALTSARPAWERLGFVTAPDGILGGGRMRKPVFEADGSVHSMPEMSLVYDTNDMF